MSDEIRNDTFTLTKIHLLSTYFLKVVAMVFHEKYLILLYGLFSLHLTFCKDCGDGIIRGVNLGM